MISSSFCKKIKALISIPKNHRQRQKNLFTKNLKKGIAFSKIHATMKLRYKHNVKHIQEIMEV